MLEFVVAFSCVRARCVACVAVPHCTDLAWLVCVLWAWRHPLLSRVTRFATSFCFIHTVARVSLCAQCLPNERKNVGSISDKFANVSYTRPMVRFALLLVRLLRG